MFRPYIISMKGELPENLKELMEYTYSDGLEEPPALVDVCGFWRAYPIRAYGVCERILQPDVGGDSDSHDDGGDVRYSGKLLSGCSAQDILEQYPLGLLFYVVPAVLLAGAAVCGILYGRRLKAQNRRLAGRLGELAQADRELAAAGEYVKGMKVYLTEHFVISASYQFEAVPYARLKQAEYSSGMVIGMNGGRICPYPGSRAKMQTLGSHAGRRD